MPTVILFSVFLGVFAVLQSGINRQIFANWGLAPAVVLNNAVIFSLGLLFFFSVKFWPSLYPQELHIKSGFTGMKWFYILPGFFGLCLVMGIPYAMTKVGATKVFVAVVIGQMLASLVWDMIHESIPLTPMRLVGVVFAVLSVLFLNWGK